MLVCVVNVLFREAFCEYILTMIILSHRANWKGPDCLWENTLAAVTYCLERGWGIETDIRRSPDKQFYISHEPAELTGTNHADTFCEIFRKFPDATIALNIKELGYEVDLIEYLNEQRVLKNMFLFDMELLETIPGRTAALFRRLDGDVKLAARTSDRNEPIEQALKIKEADIIWLDEFDRLWIDENDIRALKSRDKNVYVISPEIHGFSIADMKQRWSKFIAWGVDGICTDYSECLSGVVE